MSEQAAYKDKSFASGQVSPLDAGYYNQRARGGRGGRGRGGFRGGRRDFPGDRDREREGDKEREGGFGEDRPPRGPGYRSRGGRGGFGERNDREHREDKFGGDRHERGFGEKDGEQKQTQKYGLSRDDFASPPNQLSRRGEGLRDKESNHKPEPDHNLERSGIVRNRGGGHQGNSSYGSPNHGFKQGRPQLILRFSY